MEISGADSEALPQGSDPAEWLASRVEAADRRISGEAIRTDLVRIPWLDAPEREVWAKLECRQRTGSFKARGAFNALLALERPERGVVTASAGNHGLAVATAAAALEVACTVFVPVGVSELKLRRLAFTGAQVEPLGRDLFDSMRAARSEAERRGSAYVSAYADWEVIAGQGTIAWEAVGQTPAGFDELLVPLGGGGLLTGVGSVMRATGSGAETVAVHPEAFARKLEPGGLGELKRPVLPTIADGLAVQVGEEEDHALPLADAVCDRFVEVGEETIQAAIYAMLHNDGILVEGAGAVGVAALLDDPGAQRHRGRVMLVLSGGNISTSQLSQAMAVGVEDPRLRQLLGLRGARTALELESSGEADPRPSAQANGAGAPSAPAPSPLPEATPADEAAMALWGEALDAAVRRLESMPADLERHRRYLERQGLRVDGVVFAAVEEKMEVARGLLARCEEVRAGPAPQRRARVRLLLQIVASLRTALDWCSASSDQSIEVNFFEPRDQRGGGVSYSRYGFPQLGELEQHLLGVLGLDAERVGLCATSSGMAAYQLVEAFLLRDVLAAGDCILYAPYVYFESYEHASALPHLRHVEAASFEVDRLIAEVEREDARVLFVDPLANVPPLPAADLRALAAAVRGRGWHDRWLVVDGTMVSGAIDLFEWFDGEDLPNVLYYESASKYLQLGTDFQMAGVVAAARAIVPRLRRHRRNSGTILYELAAERFPRCSRETYLERMRQLTRNAELLLSTLEADFGSQPPFELGFPREWRHLGWRHAGGVLALRFHDPGLNNRDELEALIEIVLRECRKEGLPIAKGVSFGFATTRISASAAMAESTDPFLRFAVGEETAAEISRLAVAISRSLQSFLARRVPQQPPAPV